jgi:plasmid maintenance system antidote protein VapI
MQRTAIGQATQPGDLHNLRLRLGLEVGELAYELGLSRSQTSLLLNGRATIQPQTARLMYRLGQLRERGLWEPYPDGLA